MKISIETNERIKNFVHQKLFPDLKILLIKVLVIHFLSLLLTLVFCPQLGFKLFESKLNLMNLFMSIGPHFCEFACGAFFTSSSVLFFFIILSKDEFRFLRFHPYFMSSALFLSSLGFLLMLSPQAFVQLTFLWICGAIFGAISLMEIGYQLQLPR